MQNKDKDKFKSKGVKRDSKGRPLKRRQQYKDQGHVADDASSLCSESTTSSEPEDDNKQEANETCHILKSKSCKIPNLCWCGDTGCTAYITNKLNLFKGSIIKIKRRMIKVGGGKLYADEMGIVNIKVENASLLLPNTLYIPGLGINLLSSWKICFK